MIHISRQVADEIARRGFSDRAALALADRLAVNPVSDEELTAQQETLHAFRPHQADLSVAVLAARLQPTVVLTDDLDLRKGLEFQGHNVVGSIGILVRGRQMGQVSPEDFQGSLEHILDGSSLYLSRFFRSYVRELMRDA